MTAAKGVRIRALREAIKATLDAAPIARTIAVHAYRPAWTADQIHQYPCLIIGHDAAVGYRLTFGARGQAEVRLKLEVRTESSDCISAEMALDDLLSAGTGADSSIFDALTADPTFGGACASSVALTATPPRPMQDGEARYWSSTIALTCQMSRS